MAWNNSFPSLEERLESSWRAPGVESIQLDSNNILPPWLFTKVILKVWYVISGEG
jgi:hypothetical protein